VTATRQVAALNLDPSTMVAHERATIGPRSPNVTVAPRRFDSSPSADGARARIQRAADLVVRGRSGPEREKTRK
jgi:hypothetical protein